MKRASKQTSDDVASAAGRLLALRRKFRRGRFKLEIVVGQFIDTIDVTRDVLACAGSAESQDETKGKRKKRRK